MTKILFSEVQYFRGNLLWNFLLFTPIAIFLFMLCYQVTTGESVTENGMSNGALVVVILFVAIPAIWAERRVKLTTEIYDDKILYGWNMPTDELNELSISDIRELKVIRYSFVGYGYRISRKYGTVHNMSGSYGLQIVTHDGVKILVGTQKPGELEKIVAELWTRIS